jgi:acetyl esterase/lipase
MKNILLISILIISDLHAQNPHQKTYVYKNIDTTHLTCTIYYPQNRDTTQLLPAIIFFFGGGWVGGSPVHFSKQCTYLARRGMIAIAADYRTKKTHGTSPIECIKDAKSCMRWVKANSKMLGIDSSRIVASGGSAGGHLAASLAVIPGYNEPTDDTTISTIPAAMVLFNPVVDCTSKGYGVEKMGKDSIHASPVYHIKKFTPPVMIFHGKEDQTVPFENVQRYCNLMNGKRKFSPCTLIPFEGRSHGFFNYHISIDDFRQTLRLMDLFLSGYGFIEGDPQTELMP